MAKTTSMLCLAGLLVAMTGCASDGQLSFLGYTTRPPYDSSIQTVYVPIFANDTFQRGIEFEITRAVQREIEAKTPYKLAANRLDADTILEGKVTGRRKSPNNLNQLGEVRDVEIGLVVEVLWKDQRTGAILSTPNGMRRPDPGPMLDPNPPKAAWTIITPSASYIPELGGTTASGLDAVAKQVGRQVARMMESWDANCAK